MTKDEFTPQMDRLKSTWINAFPDERVKLIWVTVNQYCVKWFEKLVSSLISNSTKAPLPVDFINAASLEDKKRYAFDLNNNFKHNEHSVFSDDERKEFFQVMKDCSSGKTPSAQGREYARMVYRILQERGVYMDYGPEIL